VTSLGWVVPDLDEDRPQTISLVMSFPHSHDKRKKIVEWSAHF
jgi:hypothetical protein